MNDDKTKIKSKRFQQLVHLAKSIVTTVYDMKFKTIDDIFDGCQKLFCAESP